MTLLKLFPLIAIQLILYSCTSAIELKDEAAVENTKGIEFKIHDLLISDITENDFSVSLGYTKDESVYTSVLFYCNETDNPGCDPRVGNNVVLTTSPTNFYKNIKNLANQNDPSDTLNLVAIVYKDSIEISSITSVVTLKSNPIMNLSIDSDIDDGEIDESSSGFLPDGEINETVYVGNWSGVSTWGYFRFRLSSDIPKNSTVKSVIFRTRGVGVLFWNSPLHFLNIYMNDSDDAPQVTTYNDRISGINGNVATINSVRWPSTGGLNWNQAGENTSPNLSLLLQELVDKNDGLSKDNHIQLWINSPNFGVDAEVLIADRGNSDFDTTLEVTWEY